MTFKPNYCQHFLPPPYPKYSDQQKRREHKVKHENRQQNRVKEDDGSLNDKTKSKSKFFIVKFSNTYIWHLHVESAQPLQKSHCNISHAEERFRTPSNPFSQGIRALNLRTTTGRESIQRIRREYKSQRRV